MSKKAFFKERTIAQIRELNPKAVYKQRGLIERIDDLGTEEGLILNCQIIPGRFFRNTENAREASRKCYKHGETLRLRYPATKGECDKSSLIPLKLREEAVSKLRGMNEEEIEYIGFSSKPTWDDRTERITPFVWCPEALRLFAYSENTTDKIRVRVYKDAQRARGEGAMVLAEVPSRRKNVDKYMFRLLHVPVVRSQYNLSSVSILKPAQLQEGARIVSQRVPHDSANIRYPYETDPQKSEVITFYPSDIAAYIGVIRDETSNHNLTPLEMNPFALFSRRGAEIYKKLCNNLAVYDPSLNTKYKLRKPHIAEKSILLARAIGKFGHDEIAYWDPSRDGRLKDYSWEINK
jgi:hypothetical protein